MSSGAGSSAEPLCAFWHFSLLLNSQVSRTSHMSGRYPRFSRLVPPVGFVELQHRWAVAEQHHAATATDFRKTGDYCRDPASTAAGAVQSPLAAAGVPELPDQD